MRNTLDSSRHIYFIAFAVLIWFVWQNLSASSSAPLCCKCFRRELVCANFTWFWLVVGVWCVRDESCVLCRDFCGNLDYGFSGFMRLEIFKLKRNWGDIDENGILCLKILDFSGNVGWNALSDCIFGNFLIYGNR